MTKETFDFYKKNGLITSSPCVTITRLIDMLIAALYAPTLNSTIYCRDGIRCEKFSIDDGEPINWGDLKCIEVVESDGTFIATINEAQENDCPTFCAYIEGFLDSWGWKVQVKTEW